MQVQVITHLARQYARHKLVHEMLEQEQGLQQCALADAVPCVGQALWLSLRCACGVRVILAGALLLRARKLPRI